MSPECPQNKVPRTTSTIWPGLCVKVLVLQAVADFYVCDDAYGVAVLQVAADHLYQAFAGLVMNKPDNLRACALSRKGS